MILGVAFYWCFLTFSTHVTYCGISGLFPGDYGYSRDHALCGNFVDFAPPYFFVFLRFPVQLSTSFSTRRLLFTACPALFVSTVNPDNPLRFDRHIRFISFPCRFSFIRIDT